MSTCKYRAVRCSRVPKESLLSGVCAAWNFVASKTSNRSNILLKVPKKILKINFYANLSASSSECFFNIESILCQISGKEGGEVFTINCLFHFSLLRIYKLKQFQNELIFNEASCLSFSSYMTVLQLPFITF